MYYIYHIMSRDLKSYRYSYPDAFKEYENTREAHLNERDVRFGDVLVRYKKVKSHFSIRFNFHWRGHWYWKPRFEFNRYSKYLHWLNLMMWFETGTTEIMESVVTDHLKERIENPENRDCNCIKFSKFNSVCEKCNPKEFKNIADNY